MNKTSLLELAKKLNIPHRNCIKTKEDHEEAIKDTIKGYKEIIFSSDTPVSMACLDELRKQQIIDQHVYDQRLIDDTIRKLAWEGLQKNIVMDGDTMIDKRTGVVLDPEAESAYWKDKFQVNFIVFIDHKITCLMVEEFHILNDIGTLGPSRLCDFS